MRSQGALEGRRYGRRWGEVGDAGGCGARARRHVPTSGGCRRGAGGEGWESHRVGPLRELFHVRLASRCGSSAGGNAEPRVRQRVMACHHCVPQRAAYEGVGATGCHGSGTDTRIVSVLTCEKIFAEAQACTDAELYCRELCWTRPCCEPC